MHIDSEYEKLIKEGYIEAGTLVVHVDDLAKMEISSHVHEDMKREGARGERQDKSVVIVDKHGNRKRASHIPFGNNKKGVKLSDGSFMNSDELMAAMNEAISQLKPGTILVDRKGRFTTPEELLQVVNQAAGKILIGEIPGNIRNLGRLVSVVGADSETVHRKGTMVIGPKSFDIGEGEFVNFEEFMKALNDYVIMYKGEETKKDPEPVPQPIEPKTPTDKENDNPILVRVVRKYKNRLAAWLLLLALLATALTGFRKEIKYEDQLVPRSQIVQMTRLVERENLHYHIQEMEYEDILETYQQFMLRNASELNIGDPFYLQDGDEFYETSSLTGRKGIVGQGIRKAGNYDVTGISIYCNNHYYGSFVDLDASEAGYNLGTFINNTVTKYGLNYDELELRLHLGNSKDYTIAGWSNISSLIQEDEITPEVIGKKAVEGSTYDGVVTNFTGSTITIDTLDGKVEIPVMDASGKLYEAGTTVYGSNGQEYIISDLEIVDETVRIRESVTQTEYVNEQVAVGKKLTWRVQDCNLTVAIAPLLAALASYIATKKKNKEAEKNPNFFEFEDEAEYQKFKKEFEEAKEKYEKTSGFKKMIKDVFYRKEVDLLQRLTEEQIQALYAAIRNCHNGDYSYNPSDKIEFKNGKIIITFKDGRHQDITDIIMPSIAQIGKENSYETEGRLELEEEEKNEVRTR